MTMMTIINLLLDYSQFLVEFLDKLPDEILAIITIISIFMVDVFYTFWILFVNERKKYKAGIMSMLLYLSSFTGISSILEINNVLLFPALFAAFLGTVITLTYQEKKEKK